MDEALASVAVTRWTMNEIITVNYRQVPASRRQPHLGQMGTAITGATEIAAAVVVTAAITVAAEIPAVVITAAITVAAAAATEMVEIEQLQQL